MRRVLLVDDHPLFRAGVRRVLEESGRYRVVGEAGTGHEAIRLAQSSQPDLVLLDVQLPGITGLTVARILRRQNPRARLVVLSIHVDDDRLVDAVRVGGSAFLLKGITPPALLHNLGRVMRGENLLRQTVLARQSLARRLITEFRLPPDDPLPPVDLGLLPLSVRELEVLDCVAQGLSNKEVAAALFVTEQTVKNHITSVLRKVDVNDRVQAVLHAVRQGWIELRPPGARTGDGSDDEAAPPTVAAPWYQPRSRAS